MVGMNSELEELMNPNNAVHYIINYMISIAAEKAIL
jgi:hypothetical protein